MPCTGTRRWPWSAHDKQACPQVMVSHGASLPVRADDRERCLELCRVEDPSEYPLFENINMDVFLIQVVFAVFAVLDPPPLISLRPVLF